MRNTHPTMTLPAGILISFLFLESGWAIVDPDNMGQWTKPTNSGPDKDVPGFLVNLGPTGARAILKEKSFVVKYVFPKSPAHNKLNIDDEIIGVNDKMFTTKHIFGKQYGMGYAVGYEGPIMDFGTAIEDSEGRDGILKLAVIRNGKETTVKVPLPAVGRFSKTYPLKCPKSDKLVADAMQYLLKHTEDFGSQCHARGTAGLALLSQGRLEEAKAMAASWNKAPGEGAWTWPIAYQCIFLSEYYLKTKDKSVLGTIQLLVARLYEAQVMDPAMYKDRMHSGQPQGENFLKGGLGHVVKIDGYGTMAITTLMALLAWELAEDCGVKLDQQHVDLAFQCVREHTNESGYIGYRFATGAYSPVGRQGLAIIAHKLAQDKGTEGYVARVTANLTKSKTRLNDGHGDNVLGILWGLLGIQLSGDSAAIREVFDYNKAFINMARTHDGSFVAQPGRNNGDKGYYLSSRIHPTAAMVLVLGMSRPSLRIQGVEVSIQGVNPKALEGRMDAAYKAIVKKDYKAAFRSLYKPLAGDEQVAKAMSDYIDAQWQKEVAGLEPIEKSGDILSLAKEYIRLVGEFKGIEGFDKAIKRYEDGLDKDPWRKEVLTGKAYLSYLGVLQKYKSASAVKKLDQFVADNAGSIYGKWTAAVVKEFKADGTISVSAAGKPFGER